MSKSGKGAAQRKFGRYNALTKLGQGAMATVYLAEDPSLNRMVAIKVIHSHLTSNSSLLDRFTVEAKTAAGLRNPNIVEIFDYGVEDDLQYLVMEYIDGPNLQFVLNLLGGQPMDPDVVAAVIFQAAEGLHTADRFNVVHRDIKPENIMFMSDGKLKIADFGIAHISEQNLTQTGSILGSPNFMSPEQIDGKKPTHQTDMFSLGAVFYYCLLRPQALYRLQYPDHHAQYLRHAACLLGHHHPRCGSGAREPRRNLAAEEAGGPWRWGPLAIPAVAFLSEPEGRARSLRSDQELSRQDRQDG